MVLGMIALVVVLVLVQLPMRAAHLPDLVAWPILIAVSLGAYAAWVRLVERRRVDELAPSAALPDGAFGLTIGLVLFTVTMTLLALAGAYRFGGFNSWSPLAVGIADAVGAAVTEELLFRGFLFRVVRDVGGTWTAVAVSAIVFGALHAFNPGASLLSTIAIALEAGVSRARLCGHESFVAADRLARGLELRRRNDVRHVRLRTCGDAVAAARCATGTGRAHRRKLRSRSLVRRNSRVSRRERGIRGRRDSPRTRARISR